jgi:hypothetical protein
MYRNISEMEFITKDARYYRWRKDRNDVYLAEGTQRCVDSLSIRIFYKIYEVNCNPDMDW